MKYSEIIINGNTFKKKDLVKMIKAFNNSTILNSYGGYIYTFRIHNNNTYMGIKPSIIDGQRSNHYNLVAGPETKVFLTGGINPNGEISLLFKISEKELTNELKFQLKEHYIQFADLLITNKYNGKGNLEWISRKMLEESQLFFPIPNTIFDFRIKS
jgi:hypothetical protein